MWPMSARCGVLGPCGHIHMHPHLTLGVSRISWPAPFDQAGMMTTGKPRLQGAACIVTGGSSGLGTLSPHPCMHAESRVPGRPDSSCCCSSHEHHSYQQIWHAQQLASASTPAASAPPGLPAAQIPCLKRVQLTAFSTSCLACSTDPMLGTPADDFLQQVVACLDTALWLALMQPDWRQRVCSP